MSTVVDLRGRSLLKLADFSADEIRFLLDLAAQLKAAKKDGREEQLLKGREIALIFEKDSTRTRCAFEVAAYDQAGRTSDTRRR
jgi:ornithine carbamoyltransferase